MKRQQLGVMPCRRVAFLGAPPSVVPLLLLLLFTTALLEADAVSRLRDKSQDSAKLIGFRQVKKNATTTTTSSSQAAQKNVEVPFLVNATTGAFSKVVASAKAAFGWLNARASAKASGPPKAAAAAWLNNKTLAMHHAGGASGVAVRLRDQPRCGSATGVSSSLCALCRYCCDCNGGSPQCSSGTVSVGGNVVMCSDCTGGTVAGTYFGDCGACPQFAGSVCPGSSALCPGGDCCDGSSFVPALDYQCAT